MLNLLDQSTGDWQKRLAVIVETMREISRQTDPQAMVRIYGQRMRQFLPVDGSISLSRRGLTFPAYRITRSSTIWLLRPTIRPPYTSLDTALSKPFLYLTKGLL